MKYLPLLAFALLPGCVSDARIAQIQADHRAYVCAHTATVTLAANGVIANAEKLFPNADARAAAVAIARNDIAIVAACPVAESH